MKNLNDEMEHAVVDPGQSAENFKKMILKKILFKDSNHLNNYP